MDLRKRWDKLKDTLFEPENIPPPPEDRTATTDELFIEPSAEPQLILEPKEGSSIDGDIDSAAQELIEEELTRVISADAEDTIFKVEACVQFVGELAPPETVCMMLQNVAGKDPAILAEDGKLRVATIEQFIKDTFTQMDAILQETREEAERIKEERESTSSAYANSCEAAHRHYEEQLKAIQAELEEELRSIKNQNDECMAKIEARSIENAKKREDVQKLSRSIDAHGRSMIERISKLLTLITINNDKEAK